MRLHWLGLIAALALGQTAFGVGGSLPVSNASSLHRAVVSGDWIGWAEYGTDFNTSSIYAINVNNPTAEGRIKVADKTAVVDTWAYWNAQFAMDGNSIFWVDDRQVTGPDFQLYQSNLGSTGEKIIGPTDWNHGERPGYPSVSGSRMVWQAWGYGYDGNDMPYMGLAISNPWTDDPSAMGPAVATFQRETGSSQDGWPVPSISGDWVVWKDDRPSKHGGLWAYNVVSQQTLMIKEQKFLNDDETKPLFDVRAPVIDGNDVDGYKVAWCQRAWSYPEGLPATSVNQIVTLDLNNFDPQNPAAAERIIANTSSTLHRSDISISGDVVVWEDWRNNSKPPDPLFANANVVAWAQDATANVDIYAYDLINNMEIPIPDAMTTAVQLHPWIDGNKVVWWEYDQSTKTQSLKWTQIDLPGGGLGDVNLDGLVNALDISDFIDRLVKMTYQLEADTNEDGLVNALDISSFVDLLVHAGGGTAVPEPGTGLLMVVGMALGMGRRR